MEEIYNDPRRRWLSQVAVVCSKGDRGIKIYRIINQTVGISRSQEMNGRKVLMRCRLQSGGVENR